MCFAFFLILTWASSGITGGFQNAILKKFFFILRGTTMITNSNLEGMSLFSGLVGFLSVCLL